jgi:hypothetical protein
MERSVFDKSHNLIRNNEQISVCFLVFIWFQYLIIEQYRKISIFIYLSFHTKILIYAYFFSSFFIYCWQRYYCCCMSNFRLVCSDLYYLFVRFYYRKKTANVCHFSFPIYMYMFVCMCLWMILIFILIHKEKKKRRNFRWWVDILLLFIYCRFYTFHI